MGTGQVVSIAKVHVAPRSNNTHGTGTSTGPPFALSSARFFLSFASSIHWSSELSNLTTFLLSIISSKLVFHVRSSWSTICPRKLSSTSGLYCAAVGKHDAKFLDEHLSRVALEAWLKTLMRPCARGPGASAIGGAGVGEGERELGSVAAGIMGYRCLAMRDGGKLVVAEYLLVLKVVCTSHGRLCLPDNTLGSARASVLPPDPAICFVVTLPLYHG